MQRSSFKNFLEDHLEKNDMPFLEYTDKSQREFIVPWPKKDSKHVLQPNPIEEWAKKNGRFGEKRDFTDHKHTFDAALKSAQTKSNYLKSLGTEYINRDRFTDYPVKKFKFGKQILSSFINIYL